MSDDHERPDPRDRPADPAGTQPKVDPESLLPEPVERPYEADAYEFEFDDGPEPRQIGAGASEPLPAVAEPAGAMAEATPIPRETQHTPRFQFLLGALLAIGAVGLAAAVAIALRPEPVQIDPAAGWSAWRPIGSDPVNQISSHVQHQYRLPSGRDLVLVAGGPMSFVGLPAQVVLEKDGNLSLLKGQGVIYRLCGAGANCSISQGKASSQRMLLLRREALELALYTFRYIANVDQAVVFLPPAPGQKQGATALFRKDTLTPQLLRPLNSTLARRTPSVAGVESSPDATMVKSLTPALYTPRLAQQNADAGLYLVLKPIDTTAKSPTTTQPAGSSSSSSSSSGTSTSTNPADPSKALTLP